jgi:hypothetical protein
MRFLPILIVPVVALSVVGCSSSDGNTAVDEAAIEAALHQYAEALDWPRGTGWEETFNPVAPATWPVEQWEDGYELFRSLYTDDAVLDYESLCMTIEADLPEGTIDFLGMGDETCPVLGLRIRGSLDFFYYGITLGTQLESETTITPITIEVDGNTATSEDSYVHTAVLNHHLLDEPPPVTDMQEGFHLGEWAKGPDGWKLTHWEGVIE